MNVAMLLDMAADGFGGRVAVGGRDYGWSFDELRRRAVGVARRLEWDAAGTLALVRPNGPAVPAALFGSAWAGRTYAPVNYRLPPAALDDLVAQLQPAHGTGRRSHRSPTTRRHRRCSFSPAERRRSRRQPSSTMPTCSRTC